MSKFIELKKDEINSISGGSFWTTSELIIGRAYSASYLVGYNPNYDECMESCVLLPTTDLLIDKLSLPDDSPFSFIRSIRFVLI